MMCLQVLLIVLLASPSLGGVWRSTSEKTTSWLDGVVGGIEAVTRTTGNYLPIRGVAGYMADAGIPGGAWLRKTLTPQTMRSWDRLDQQPSFKNDFLYMVGAVLGEDECTRKLACRSGKRVSSLPGTSLVTMGLAAATEYIPEGLRGSYNVLRDSLMYSDDCEQFQCQPSTGLAALSEMADDLGIPVGGYLAQYMREGKDEKEKDEKEEKKLKIEKELVQQLVMAIAGDRDCGKLLACTLARRVAGIPGASTLVYFMDSGGVPEYMVEAMDVFRMSVMLGDDCARYQCRANRTMEKHLDDQEHAGEGDYTGEGTDSEDDQKSVVEQKRREEIIISEKVYTLDKTGASEDDLEMGNHIPWFN